MKSFIPVLISVIPIPILMISFGVLWKRNIPKNVNWIYGYRSFMSMKNDEIWKYAHLYQAKIWRWSGAVLLIFSLVFSLTFKKGYEEIPSWIFYTELAIMVLSIVPTELSLIKKFNKEGNVR